MIIDAHCHAGNFEPLFRGEHPADELVAAWDAAGVGAGVISVLTKGRMTDANDAALEAAVKYPGRVYACIYLDPGDLGAALAELARCATSGLFRGVKLHPDQDTWFPYLEKYYPLYEAIAEAGLPVLMHSGTAPYSSPLACAAAARDFPQIPWILGHAGLGDLMWEIIPAARQVPNIMVDTALNPCPPVLAEWVQRFGSARMMWGSDWPFGGMTTEVAKLADLRLTGAGLAAVSAGNAARVFGIPGPAA